MKKKFCIEVTFNNYRTVKSNHITSNEIEIDFFTYFVKNYNKDLYNLAKEPEKLLNLKNFEGKKIHYREVLNKMIKLYNKMYGENTLEEIGEDDDIYGISCRLTDILFDMITYFDIYDDGDENYGFIVKYEIIDIEE